MILKSEGKGSKKMEKKGGKWVIIENKGVSLRCFWMKIADCMLKEVLFKYYMT